MIQSNLYKYLCKLLEGHEHFEEEILADMDGSSVHEQVSASDESDDKEVAQCTYSLNPKLKHFPNWLLEIMAMGDLDGFFAAATREYAPIVDEMWRDPAIQAIRMQEEMSYMSSLMLLVTSRNGLLRYQVMDTIRQNLTFYMLD